MKTLNNESSVQGPFTIPESLMSLEPPKAAEKEHVKMKRLNKYPSVPMLEARSSNSFQRHKAKDFDEIASE